MPAPADVPTLGGVPNGSVATYRPAMTNRILLSLLLVLCTGAAQAAGFTARVVGVADGDTLTVLDEDRHQHVIRLAEIDAPEKAQAFGSRSKASSTCPLCALAGPPWSRRDRPIAIDARSREWLVRVLTLARSRSTPGWPGCSIATSRTASCMSCRRRRKGHGVVCGSIVNLWRHGSGERAQARRNRARRPGPRVPVVRVSSGCFEQHERPLRGH